MFEVLAVTERWVLIDKHPDVSFHREDADIGLLDALRAATGLPALYPVHRLDAITSGLLLFARDPATAAARWAAPGRPARWASCIWPLRRASRAKSKAG